MLAIIDYNIGNLASVYNACKTLGKKVDIVSEAEKLKDYNRIILPGVGAFGDAIAHLEQSGMKDAVMQYAKSGKPLLGICLGMQLLFDSSDEFGQHKGLGLISGEVVKFDKNKMKENMKIPHIGWNSIANKKSALFEGLENPYLYFVHSFHIQTKDENVLGYTQYGYKFASAVQKDNIFGIQPHPEKSHDSGLRILKNFIELK